MSRVTAALVLVAALAVTLAGSAAGGPQQRSDVTGTILLRARIHQGPWKQSLSIKFVQLQLKSFTLCAIWNHQAGEKFDCDAASKSKLPEGTTLRLEQSPVGKAVKRPESPGWGMIGASPDAALGAVVSNLVTGNKRGTFHYRVTLRDRTNKVLVTSNVFTVVWR